MCGEVNRAGGERSRMSQVVGSIRAVDEVSFEVEAGEVFALPGPNGAGKTTTIEILEGFRERDAGE
jgi:ABC-2 type transport system ATP-binding protein